METVSSGREIPLTGARAASPSLRFRTFFSSASLRLRRFFPSGSLRLTTAERRLLLVLFDVLTLNAALLGTLVLRYEYAFSWTALAQSPFYFVLLTAVWMLWAVFFNCYDLPRAAHPSQSAWSAGRAALLTALTYLAIPFITPQLPASRLSTYLFVGLATISVPVWRLLWAILLSQPTFQERLLIVGAGDSGTRLARELARTPQRGNPYAGSGFQVVGFVDDDPAKSANRIEGLPILGNRHDLTQLVRDHDVDIVVVAICNTPQIHPQLFQAMLECREQNVRVEPMTNLFERLTGRVPVEYAGNDLYVVMPLNDSATRRVFEACKRLIDLVATSFGCLLLVMIAPVVALANAIWCPGPLFFRQVRVGQRGKLFSLLKFRSMIPEAEKGCGAVWASENDDRVTPVGRFLRKTRLDELPQAMNILKGEMSLVGPRPERPEFVADLVKTVPFYQARHAVRPGLTGWAQVRYRYGNSVEDSLVKLQYDLYYIKRQSFYLETSILVKTAAVMLRGEGQ
jgi:exopolysaccharide biosynthesis polyprenyl glycosylphosphotransferase